MAPEKQRERETDRGRERETGRERRRDSERVLKVRQSQLSPTVRTERRTVASGGLVYVHQPGMHIQNLGADQRCAPAGEGGWRRMEDGGWRGGGSRSSGSL